MTKLNIEIAERMDKNAISSLPSNQRPTKAQRIAAAQYKKEIRDEEFRISYAYFSGNDDYLDISDDDKDGKESYFY